MPAKEDYYSILGVERKATQEDIKKSYRRLARKHHPDLNPGDKAAEERFKKLQQANDVLSDPKKREMYDQVGFYSENGYAQQGGPQPQDPGMGFSGFDFSDFTAGTGGRGQAGAAGAAGAGAGAGSFRDLFSQFFGRSGHSAESAEAERGSDLEYVLNIDFWQAIRGTQAKLSIARHDVCATCHGSGSTGGASARCPQCEGTGNVNQMAGSMKFTLSCPRCGGTGVLHGSCPTCHGDGRVARTETVEVRIPAGAQNGSRLRVPGKGNAGTMGMPAGDLFITARVEPHPLFQREGDNIEIRVPVSITEAGLGAKIEVPTIEGRALLKIPPGTQNAQRFRLREKGVFNSRKSVRGDQIVEVSVVVPKVQDERTKEILRELSQLHPDDPRAELWTKV
ncbi:MAG: molecular chaperone DnaJ [Bryobacteraceae bacterium]